jgi:DNA-binding NtrC family response regulator
LAHRILIVSDDSRLLDSHKDLLAGDFTVETVPGSTRALATMQMFGPFAVILAEMRMSGLSGVEFLVRARELAPDTVGILLTGSRDHNQAVRAVKQGRIFHYLVKPCAKNELVIAVHLGLARYRTNWRQPNFPEEADALRLSAAGIAPQEPLSPKDSTAGVESVHAAALGLVP